MATPKQKSSKKLSKRPLKKPQMAGKATYATDIDLKTVGELVENLKELHRWQGAVLDKLAKQAYALRNVKKL